MSAQLIIVYAVVALAVALAVRGVVSAVRKPDKCAGCAECPFAGGRGSRKARAMCRKKTDRRSNDTPRR